MTEGKGSARRGNGITLVEVCILKHVQVCMYAHTHQKPSTMFPSSGGFGVGLTFSVCCRPQAPAAIRGTPVPSLVVLGGHRPLRKQRESAEASGVSGP